MKKFNIILCALLSYISATNAQELAKISGNLSTTFPRLDVSKYEVIAKNINTNDSIKTQLTKNVNGNTASYTYELIVNKGESYFVYLNDVNGGYGDHLNGISTLDLVMIQRHILGIKKFETPGVVRAADVTMDGRISTFDLVYLRRLILGIDTILPIKESWIYPLTSDLNMDKAIFNNVNEDIAGVDFTPIKLGDINKNAVGNEGTAGEYGPFYSCDLVTDTVLNLLTLSSTYSLPDTLIAPAPSPICEGGGTPSNMSWIAFQAGNGNYNIEITPTNCIPGVGGQNGIQAGVYTDCSFSESIICLNACTTNKIEIISSIFTPGQVYYLFIDGCSKSVCNYTVNISGDYSPF